MIFRIIKYSSLTYLFSTVTNQLRELSVHIPSLNPSFSALDEDVYYATKEKVAHELPFNLIRPCGPVPEYSGFPNIIVLLAEKFGICRAYVILQSWAYPRDIN